MKTTLEQVKPETIALLEANAKRNGLAVDDYLRSLLPADENELALKADADERIDPQESAAEREVKRQKSIAWIKAHRQEYGGFFVALDGDQLIATGKKHLDVRKAAIQKGFQQAFIGDVLPLGYEGFCGGWE